MTGVKEGDIVDASFVNLVHIVPFFVVKVEREGRKELIIAVRGTLSIKVRGGAVGVASILYSGEGFCGGCGYSNLMG